LIAREHNPTDIHNTQYRIQIIDILTESHLLSPPQFEQGNMEGARIYAENAMREKKQQHNCLKMSSRIDAVASRLETAIRMNQLTKAMTGVVKGMGAAMKSMNVEKISKTMDEFEKQFEDMDVKSGVMEGAMNNQAASMTPADEVNSVLQMVAEENGMELNEELASAGTKAPVSKEPVVKEKEAGDDLQERLAALRR